MGITATSDLATTVETALRENYAGAKIILDVDEDPEGQIINGFILWSAYEFDDHRTRQARLREILGEHLTDAEQRRVHLLMTVTPDEYAAMREPQL